MIFTTSKSPICFRVDFNSNWFWFSISLLLYLLFPCFFLHDNDSIVLWLVIWLVIFSLVVYYSRKYVGSNNISCWTEVQRYYYDPRHHSYPPPLSIRVKLVFISKACPYFFLKHVVQFIVQVNHSAKDINGTCVLMAYDTFISKKCNIYKHDHHPQNLLSPFVLHICAFYSSFSSWSLSKTERAILMHQLSNVCSRMENVMKHLSLLLPLLLHIVLFSPLMPSGLTVMSPIDGKTLGHRTM